MRHHTATVLAVLAAAGCGSPADDTSPVTQIGQRVIPVESVRTEQAAPDWKLVEQRLAELGIGEPSSVKEFIPSDAIYGPSGDAVFRHDTCGIASDLASVFHEVKEVSASYHSYLNDYLVTAADGYQDVVKTLDCEFTGHVYRCNASTDKIDFRSLGLDAQVSVVNNEFGSWFDPTGALPDGTGYLGFFTYEISCKGKDCAKEPAASLFGFLTRPLPCSGDEGVELFAVDP